MLFLLLLQLLIPLVVASQGQSICIINLPLVNSHKHLPLLVFHLHHLNHGLEKVLLHFLPLPTQSPLLLEETVLDFIAELKLPVLLVARAGLGTINHTLLSLHELRRAQVPVTGIVLNVTRAEDAANLEHSLPEILRFAGGLVPVVVPHFPEDGPWDERVKWVAFMLRDGLDVMALMA